MYDDIETEIMGNIYIYISCRGIQNSAQSYKKKHER